MSDADYGEKMKEARLQRRLQELQDDLLAKAQEIERARSVTLIEEGRKAMQAMPAQGSVRDAMRELEEVTCALEHLMLEVLQALEGAKAEPVPRELGEMPMLQALHSLVFRLQQTRIQMVKLHALLLVEAPPVAQAVR